jgi:hypothetical protein
MTHGSAARVALALGLGVASFLAPLPSALGQSKGSPNFERPRRDPQGGENHFTVTICDHGAQGFIWKNPYNIQGEGSVAFPEPDPADKGKSQHADARSNGTDGSVELIGNSVGERDLTFGIRENASGRQVQVFIHVYVIHCPPPPRAAHGSVRTAPQVQPGSDGQDLTALHDYVVGHQAKPRGEEGQGDSAAEGAQGGAAMGQPQSVQH